MGVDLRMTHATAAISADLNPRLSLNWTAMRLVIDLLDTTGVIEWSRDLDHSGERAGDAVSRLTARSPDDGRGNDLESGHPTSQDVRVPAAKLTYNEGQLVSPVECEALFAASQRTASAFEDEVMVGDGSQALESSGRDPMAAAELVNRFASFCRHSAQYGGFVVY